MYDDSVVPARSRARFFPYIFGTLTGVAVALAVISMVMLKRERVLVTDSAGITTSPVVSDGEKQARSIPSRATAATRSCARPSRWRRR